MCVRVNISGVSVCVRAYQSLIISNPQASNLQQTHCRTTHTHTHTHTVCLSCPFQTVCLSLRFIICFSLNSETITRSNLTHPHPERERERCVSVISVCVCVESVFWLVVCVCLRQVQIDVIVLTGCYDDVFSNVKSLESVT